MRSNVSNLIEHAERELRLAGFADGDSDYDGMLYDAVMALVKVFSEQGHSGMSASITLQLFDRVAQYKTLGSITNNPDEWVEVAEKLWQNKRDSECFSTDGGKTYSRNSEMVPGQETPAHTTPEKVTHA